MKTVELSVEQKDVVDAVMSRVKNGDKLITIGGYAGTGKTTIAKYLDDRLRRFVVCAYTGKAVDRLKLSGMDASTIHRTIYRPRDDDTKKGGVRFELKTRNELGCDGFLIDEGSMVGTEIFGHLSSFGLPIVVLGDHGQLPPVGDDAGLMLNPDHKLETIHRNAGPIAKFAEHLRKGYPAKDWQGGDCVWVIPKKSVTPDQLARADQVICAYNRTRVGLNKTIRKQLGRDGDGPIIGDRVICLQNDNFAGCFNGQQGEIDLLESDYILRFKPRWGELVVVGYHPEAWNAEKTPKRVKGAAPGCLVPFDFAYAVTCHKAQGDEFDKVIVFEERCDLWEHRRWCYTAASRAKGKLIWAQ